MAKWPRLSTRTQHDFHFNSIFTTQEANDPKGPGMGPRTQKGKTTKTPPPPPSGGPRTGLRQLSSHPKTPELVHGKCKGPCPGPCTHVGGDGRGQAPSNNHPDIGPRKNRLRLSASRRKHPQRPADTPWIFEPTRFETSSQSSAKRSPSEKVTKQKTSCKTME